MEPDRAADPLAEQLADQRVGRDKVDTAGEPHRERTGSEEWHGVGSGGPCGRDGEDRARGCDDVVAGEPRQEIARGQARGGAAEPGGAGHHTQRGRGDAELGGDRLDQRGEDHPREVHQKDHRTERAKEAAPGHCVVVVAGGLESTELRAGPRCRRCPNRL